jgi:predicted transcriptional regulator
MKNLFRDEVTGKILLFFNENPHSIDTAKGISVWIGCDINKIQRSLAKLTKMGIVVNHKSMSTNAYSYTTEKDIIKKVEKHIKSMV